MRPRQNLRDFHHNSSSSSSSSSSYQSMNHNTNLLQQQRQQSHPPAGTPPLLATSVGGSIAAAAATRVIQSPLPTPDMISELMKLGLNPDDMAKQNNRQDMREDVYKNFQAILSRRGATDLLQKLPPLNEFVMQSIAPSEFTRNVGGNSGSTNHRDSVICGPSGIVGSGSAGTSGPTGFTNNIKNGSSNKQEQDLQYSSAQHQANHHQHFRIPTTNTTTVHNSSKQQQQQSQHKSVLSIHQQQHQHDPTNRRLNHQQHSMSAASSSSFSNLNDISRASPSSSTLESHNSNIFSRSKTSPPLNSYTITSASSAPRAQNIIDALGTSVGGGPTGQLDNMYDNTAFQQHNINASNQQQSLIRHQQLQRLLRASVGGAAKTAPSLTTSNMSSRSDLHPNHRQGNNVNSMPQMQRQLTSPTSSSAISPTQQPLSSVPKSLLNLAACTSKSSQVACGISSISKNSRVFQQPNNGSATSNPVPNNRTATPRQTVNSNGAFNSRIQSSVDTSNILQMIARSNQAKSANNGLNKANPNHNQALTSLLSDDQKGPRSGSGTSITQLSNNLNKGYQQPVSRRQSQPNDDTNAVQTSAKSKEAYLAYLQERASKAGISIGETNKDPDGDTNTSQSNNQGFDTHLSASTNANSGSASVRKDHEARNDLSLLYPPISLATSSQRQVNFLAAGLDINEGFDVITEEVKKIIQEECNIIYECKGCSNLFRSLANLVKHKRQFCDNSINDRANADLSRQFLMNVSSNEAPVAAILSTVRSTSNRTLSGEEKDNSPMDVRQSEHLNASVSIGTQKYNLRGKRIDSAQDMASETRSTRVTRSHDRRDQREQLQSGEKNFKSNSVLPAQQTNLSRLLQSQPKNRQPPTKDSALMDALNMPNPSNTRRSVMSRNLNENLVKNSSLAKTLLNENAKSMSSGNSVLQPTEPILQQSKTRPKRKYLEDCIQKVKRDKLVTGLDGDQQDSSSAQDGTDLPKLSKRGNREPLDDMGQFKDPLALDDSDADSDALVMDLEEPSRALKSKRKPPRDIVSEGDRMHEASSNNKLNTSSALLKALTRPVEARSTYVNNPRCVEDKVSIGSTDAQDGSSVVVELGDEAQSTSTQESSVDDATNSDAGRISKAEPDLEVIPLSPLFDRYTCEMCDTDLDNQPTLMAHVIERHKTETKIYPCLFCSFTFITLENVCRHIMDMHKKTITQVGHLKEVVRSRSFISQDFKACSDFPATIPLATEDKVEDDGAQKLEAGTVKPEGVNTRRSSSALSDSAATKQILEDTLALVSNTSSPETLASTGPNRLAAILSRARCAERRSTTKSQESEAGKAPDQNQVNDETEDPLCDSLLTNLTEHLAILESQEAEIEAEKLRRSQETEGDNSIRAKSDEDRSAAVSNIESAEEATSEVLPSNRDDETSRASAEFRNQQTTPSRGKHIVAGQPFDDGKPHNSDQDDDDDDDDEDDDDDDDDDDADLDFEQESNEIANNGSYDEMNEVEESQDDDDDDSGGSTDEHDCDDSEPESLNSRHSDSMDKDDPEDRDDECQDESDSRPSRVSSKRERRKRGLSRGDDDDDDDDDYDNAEAHNRQDESDTDLNLAQANDKTAAQIFTQVGLTKEATSKATSILSTMDAGGCKLKVKSSVLRDVCGGSGTSSAGAVQSGGSSAISGEGSGGGIKKLKIQLKAQPDEKSKVYRIVN